MAVAAATTFALLAIGGFLLRLYCDLTLNLMGFERDVCDSFGVYALVLVAAPAATLVAGSISRRTGRPFVFYAVWTTAVAFGVVVIAWVFVSG
jgi:hypothetical protein